MTSEEIARVCHEANRLYCWLHGDFSHKLWSDTPYDIRQSVISGVEDALADPSLTARQSHENWTAFKRRHCWVYGPEKDYMKLTHPNLVPYDELPEVERKKDELFLGIVRALA